MTQGAVAMRGVLAAVLLSSLPRVHACSCFTPATPCQKAGSAAAAFTGTVMEIVDPPAQPAPTGTSERRPGNRMAASRLSTDRVPELLPPRRAVRMRVGEVLGGLSAEQKEVEIVTGLGGGDCGYDFEPGGEYVVYAYKDAAGRLATGICTGTRPLSQAADDLDYFRAVANVPAAGQLRVHTGWRDNPGKPAQWIVAEREESRYTAETDAAGVATFTTLPPGEYAIHAERDGQRPDDPTVRVNAKGCQDITLFRVLRIAGRVTTSNGLPAAGVEVQCRSTESAWGGDATTGPDGSYELRVLKPGSYYLGVNLSRTATQNTPYPRWLHPGTRDPAAATIIEFSGKPDVLQVDLTLPQPLDQRVIEGVVLKSDGIPMARARVSVLDSSLAAVATAITDQTGRFILKVFADTSYRVHAVRTGDAAQAAISAVPADIPAGSGPLAVRLVLTEPGNSLLEASHQKR